jgi:hypothetical protein
LVVAYVVVVCIRERERERWRRYERRVAGAKEGRHQKVNMIEIGA